MKKRTNIFSKLQSTGKALLLLSKLALAAVILRFRKAFMLRTLKRKVLHIKAPRIITMRKKASA